MAVAPGPPDLEWCALIAAALVDGSTTPEVVDYPKVVAGANTWTRDSKTSPAETVGASQTVGVDGFRVTLPQPTQLKVWFKRSTSPTARADLEAYIAAVVMHELVHTRQAVAAAPLASAPPPATPKEFLAYYEDPREIEAHGAQIAYGLLTAARPLTEATVFGTPVGSLIVGRLPGQLTGPLATRVTSVRQALTQAVNTWVVCLAP